MVPLQFAYRSHMGVEDAIIYLLHRAYSHLDKAGSAVRCMFFDFSSAFNSIQPGLLRDKLISAHLDVPTVTWIMDSLTERPQYVCLQNRRSELTVSNVGVPHRGLFWHLSFLLFTPLTLSMILGHVISRNFQTIMWSWDV